MTSDPYRSTATSSPFASGSAAARYLRRTARPRLDFDCLSDPGAPAPEPGSASRSDSGADELGSTLQAGLQGPQQGVSDNDRVDRFFRFAGRGFPAPSDFPEAAEFPASWAAPPGFDGGECLFEGAVAGLTDWLHARGDVGTHMTCTPIHVHC